MRVLLNDHAGDQLTIYEGKFFEAAFDVEDEDQGVFEGSDAAAGDPSLADGFAEKVGRTANLHGGVLVASQELLGVLAVEGVADYGFCLGLWLRLGLWQPPLDVVHG